MSAESTAQILDEKSPYYEIDTRPSEVGIVTRITFYNPEGKMGEKALMVQHHLLAIREKQIAKELEKLGWVSPQKFQEVNSKFEKLIKAYEDEITRLKKR